MPILDRIKSLPVIPLEFLFQPNSFTRRDKNTYAIIYIYIRRVIHCVRWTKRNVKATREVYKPVVEGRERRKERSHNWRAAQLSYMGTDLAYNNRMYSYVLHRLSRTRSYLPVPTLKDTSPCGVRPVSLMTMMDDYDCNFRGNAPLACNYSGEMKRSVYMCTSNDSA